MKNILVMIHDDDGEEARLQAALDLTRAVDGHLTCVDVAVLPPVMGDYLMAVGGTVILADELEAESAGRTRIEARLSHEDVAWDWVDAVGGIAGTIAKAATLADLIVLTRDLETGAFPHMFGVTEKVVMRARKPVAVVPPAHRGFPLERALIAWDGRSAAAQTMRACVPLLQRASEVRLFTAQRSHDSGDIQAAAEYLSRHGVHASVHIRADEGVRPPATLIVEESRNWHADYILMGAYNHGRLIETFGGVTSHLLTDASIPLILGHC